MDTSSDQLSATEGASKKRRISLAKSEEDWMSLILSNPLQSPLSRGKTNLKSLDSSVKTFMTAFVASANKESYGKWTRHPLSEDDVWHGLGVLITKEKIRVLFQWNCFRKETSETLPLLRPHFYSVVSFSVFDRSRKLFIVSEKRHIVLHPDAPKKVTYFEKSILPPLPTDTSLFHVSVTVSVISDQEVRDVLTSKLSACTTLPTSPATTQLITARLWESRINTDLVVVTADRKEISVHRCFLMASSPAFEAMLTHDFVEKASGRWELKDLSHDVVFQMLQFIYVDAVTSKDKDVLVPLLDVANRYDLPRLQSAAEDALVSVVAGKVSLGKFLLEVAHARNLDKLKKTSEEAVMRSMMYHLDFVPCLQLATDCCAARLQRFAGACLIAEEQSPSSRKDWKPFESAYPELARLLVGKHGECRAMACVGCERIAG